MGESGRFPLVGGAWVPSFGAGLVLVWRAQKASVTWAWHIWRSSTASTFAGRQGWAKNVCSSVSPLTVIREMKTACQWWYKQPCSEGLGWGGCQIDCPHHGLDWISVWRVIKGWRATSICLQSSTTSRVPDTLRALTWKPTDILLKCKGC